MDQKGCASGSHVGECVREEGELFVSHEVSDAASAKARLLALLSELTADRAAA